MNDYQAGYRDGQVAGAGWSKRVIDQDAEMGRLRNEIDRLKIAMEASLRCSDSGEWREAVRILDKALYGGAAHE